MLALENELHELLAETGWKPWATSRHVDETRAVGEWVDVFHFAMNLLLAVAPRNMSAEQLGELVAARYLEKRQRNIHRRKIGYDGVSDKCHECHRDLTEVGTVRRMTGRRSYLACRGCGALLRKKETA